MKHYTDEQYEDILQEKDVAMEHLENCDICRKRLEEKHAIARRLRMAFDSVKPDLKLPSRIKVQLDSLEAKAHQHHKVWPALAAAAAIIAILIPLSLYLAEPPTTMAAQEQLVKIHQSNLTGHPEFQSSSNPEKLAEYFREKLNFVPTLPHLGQGMEIRGCCVAHFKGSIVGSYVVNTPNGIISIIVVTDTPESMGMKKIRKSSESQQTYWRGSFAKCSMVTVRLGDYSYCAVAEISHDYLKDLLSRLLPEKKE